MDGNELVSEGEIESVDSVRGFTWCGQRCKGKEALRLASTHEDMVSGMRERVGGMRVWVA